MKLSLSCGKNEDKEEGEKDWRAQFLKQVKGNLCITAALSCGNLFSYALFSKIAQCVERTLFLQSLALFSFTKNKPSKHHIYPHYHIFMPFLYSLSNPNCSLFFLVFVRLTITFVSFPLRSFSVTSTTSWSGLILPLLGPQDKDSHLDFIMHAANLRAENYGISPVDKFQVRPVGSLCIFPPPSLIANK